MDDCWKIFAAELHLAGLYPGQSERHVIAPSWSPDSELQSAAFDNRFADMFKSS